jgi:hypothetical protein
MAIFSNLILRGRPFPAMMLRSSTLLGLDGTDEPQATIRRNGNETWPANTSRLSSLKGVSLSRALDEQRGRHETLFLILACNQLRLEAERIFRHEGVPPMTGAAN